MIENVVDTEFGATKYIQDQQAQDSSCHQREEDDNIS